MQPPIDRLKLTSLFALVALVLVLAVSTARAEDPVASRTATVNGLEIHYLTAGTGEPLLLLHGYAQTSQMWRSAIPALAKRFRVIAPDLPGIGDTAVPSDGIDMKTSAIRIHDFVKSLKVAKARVVGHDIGLMVAYAYAAMYPTEVDKLVLMDAFLPGIGGWEAIYHDPALWHFFFNGPTAEALVAGRERIYFEHFWGDMAGDRNRSLSEADRVLYTTAYARPGRMRAAWAYFVAFPQTAKDFAVMVKTPLPMPVLSIAGERAGGDKLGNDVKLTGKHVQTIVVKGAGHWLLDERHDEIMAALEKFL